jgi:O-succinylbenzoate synthase
MAKCAIEAALLDAELGATGLSLQSHLGGTRRRVAAGVSVGLFDTIAETLKTVDGYLADGYRRVKLKIEPGRDVDWVAAIREAYPQLPLQVDANGAYRAEDADQLERLDGLGLLLIEQPLPDDDLLGHAALAERLATPICLDEPLVSLDATRAALALRACSVVNLKAARVGGLLEAVRIHDHCVSAGVALWCGGMLESGIGRAASVALASLPGFTLPGDLSASGRFYERDLITEPFVLVDGRLDVPTGPGLGVVVDLDALDDLTVAPPVVVGRD